MTNRFFINSASRLNPQQSGLFADAEHQKMRQFYADRERFGFTPLKRLPALASNLGIRDILVKDESNRFGLSSFKIVGVTYAVSRLKDKGFLTKDSVLACATEGNHGLAVARAAQAENLAAKIYVAADTNAARIQELENAGAEVIVVDGNYDDAVEQCFRDANNHGWQIVSDTSRGNYAEIPRWIMLGYTKLMDEAESQWEENAPDIVIVQAGVGGMAGAILSWLCHRYGSRRPYTIICEPDNAACCLESARAGRPVALKGAFDTIMAGLRCGEVSPLAWSLLADGADAFVTISDAQCAAAVKTLARPIGDDSAIVAGASGACGLAALLAIFSENDLSPLRKDCRLNEQSRVFVINTETATDPQLYARIVGN